LAVSTVQASDCEQGTTKVRVRGEIDNNAVNVEYPNVPGQYTLGVADLKLRANGDRLTVNCTLLGEPTGDEQGRYQYHHMLVCNDEQQSQVAFETGFVNLGYEPDYESIFGQNPVLTDDEVGDFCAIDAVLHFVEQADVNEGRRNKGLFGSATGSLHVVGCVNIAGFDDSPIIEINMGVSGELCLPNWGSPSQ
jgi:hypothetical protein